MNKTQLLIALGCLGLSSASMAADDSKDQQRGMHSLDTDEDGRITFVEFSEQGDGIIARMDSDGNGVLTIDEFLNGNPGPRMGNRRGGDGSRPEPTEEQIAERRARMTERATQQFQEIDADGDEIVTIGEFQEANFLRMDRNNDGVLTGEELRPPRGPGQRGPRGDRESERNQAQ